MTTQEIQQRAKFESAYSGDNRFWLAQNDDGSYKNVETQDAWLEFLRGWQGSQAFIAGLAVADVSFIPKD